MESTHEPTQSVPLPEGVAALCRWIRSRRLEAPAALFLSAHRPLMPLAWSAAAMAGPFIAPFLGPNYYESIESLKDPATLDQVLARLSQPRETPGEEGTPRG